MLKTHENRNFFHIISGLIILFFSMVSLHSAAQLISMRQSLSISYKESNHAFMILEKSWYEFEKAYDYFLLNTNDETLSDVKERLMVLNRDIGYFHTVRDKYFNRHEHHRVAADWVYYDLTGHVAAFAKKLQSIDAHGICKPDDTVRDIAYTLIALQDTVLDGFVEDALHGDIEEQEHWLYWSVFVVGFCGFFLIVLIAQKLKALKLANQEKRDTYELLENRLAALEAARDGIFTMNQNSEIIYMNKSFCLLLGVDEARRDIFLGKSWGDVFSRSDYEVIEEDVLPELNKDGFWVGEFQIYREDNSSISTEMSLTRLPDGGLIGTVQDASYKKNAEQEKKALEDQFYQAQKMEAVGRLAGGVAHDFNNILAAMNGYAEFLIEDLKKDSPQKKFAENILQAGMQARSLVDQMLTFSRRSDSTKVNLDLVLSVYETLSMVNVTIPKTIELRSDIDIEHAIINANPTQISQLIMNLCVNAQDAIEDQHGNVNITMDVVDPSSLNVPDFDSVVREDLPDAKDTPYLRMHDMNAGQSLLVLGHVSKNRKYIRLNITDSGVGMSRTIMEHVFDPFFTTKPVDKGTGLGLSTVHGVLIAHCGCLMIDSALGQGTTFSLYFPLVEDAVMREAEGEDEQDNEAGLAVGAHVLLIEDQANVRDMILTLLTRLGYTTSFAESGLEGLDLIRENPTGFDVVITDHNMPKMTGLEMVNQVCEDLPDLPFILLSGHSERKMQDMIDGHPAIKAVLRKPVKKDILAETIETILQQSRDKS